MPSMRSRNGKSWPPLHASAKPGWSRCEKGRQRCFYPRYQTPLKTLLALSQPAQYVRDGLLAAVGGKYDAGGPIPGIERVQCASKVAPFTG